MFFSSAGLFDSDGNIKLNRIYRAPRICFSIKNKKTQRLVSKMLNGLGIKTSMYSNGVWINGREKCYRFSKLITSCIPHREDRLIEVRNYV